MPRNWQIGFQEPISSSMKAIVSFHSEIMFYLLIITIIITYMIIITVYLFNINAKNNIREIHREYYEKLVHNTFLEVVWTVLPAILILHIMLASFALLYIIEDSGTPEYTVKIIGHQWYWTYEIFTIDRTGAIIYDYQFDSYMIPAEEVVDQQFYIIEVDRLIFLPIKTSIRLNVSGADVIHSWAVPSFGVKTDAIPGRINQTSLYLEKETLAYGQCSELCGINHGYMPICVLAMY